MLLLLVSPIELLAEPSNRPPVPWRLLNVSRLVLAFSASLMLFLVFALKLGLSSGARLYDTQLSTASSSDPLADLATSVAFLWTACLLLIVRRKGFVRSAVVWLFTLTLSTCSLLEALWMHRINMNRDLDDVAFMLRTSFALLLLLLSSLADKVIADGSVTHGGEASCAESGKRQEHVGSSSSSGERQMTDREAASFPSILTFSWVNRLAHAGWQRLIDVQDLHRLPRGDTSDFLGQHLRSCWQGKLLPTLVIAFRWDLLHASALKLTMDAATLTSTLLLKWLLAYFVDEHQHHWHGYVIAALLFACSQLASVTRNLYYEASMTTGVRIRSALSSSLFDKFLKLSGEEQAASQATNLLSSDADRFVALFEEVQVLWTGPLLILAGLYLLWLEVAVGAIAGLAVIIGLIVVNGRVAALMPSAQASMMKQKDERINLLTQVLSGIKAIKLQAWEPAFIQRLRDMRQQEIEHLRRVTLITTMPHMVYGMTPFLVTLATFATYVAAHPSDYDLTPAKVFFVVAVLNTISAPLMLLLKQYNLFVSTAIAVRRLDQFFASQDLQEYIDRHSDDGTSIRVEKAVLKWHTSHDNAFNMDIDDMSVAEGSLTAVIGPVGCGKSSLVSAILGEMHLVTGRVSVAHGVRKTAYVPQSAWILHDTLQNNILFGQPLHEDRYRRVVRACELEADLKQLAAGDQTEIGEKGVNLSGGQR